jgi:hypothetical protein
VEDNVFFIKLLKEWNSYNPADVRMEAVPMILVGAHLAASNDTIEELHFVIAVHKAEATVAEIEVAKLRKQVEALTFKTRIY